MVGKISKQWGGFLREAYTDADNFGIQFPLDLDVKMKAAMLGACFLIVSVFWFIWSIDGLSILILKWFSKLYILNDLLKFIGFI